MTRKVVLLRSDSPSHVHLEDVLARTGMLRGVVVETGPAQRARLWRERKYKSWVWRTYQDVRNDATGRSSYARRYFRNAAAQRCPNVISVGWINDAEARAFVEAVGPDIGIICGVSLLRPNMLELLPATINIHGGVLPFYRGNHGVFFAFTRADFAHVGASVHVVEERLDAGPLLAVARPGMRPGMHDGHLVCAATRAVIAELPAILECPSLPASPQTDLAEPFRHRDRTPMVELSTWWRRRTGSLRVPSREPSIDRRY